jgi:hypothetical protein
MAYNFNGSNGFGIWGQKQVADELQKQFGFDFSEIDWKKQKGDLICRSPGNEIRIEVKTESYRSGNIAIEIGDSAGRVVGAARAHKEQADLLLYYFPALGIAFGYKPAAILATTLALKEKGIGFKSNTKNEGGLIAYCWVMDLLPFIDAMNAAFGEPEFYAEFNMVATNLDLYRGMEYRGFAPEKIKWRPWTADCMLPPYIPGKKTA